MNILSADSIGRSYGELLLFADVTLGISLGQKMALVGVNGCGKSSLLKILAGLEPSDTGEVSIRKGVKVGFLDQEPDFEPELSVSQTVFASENPVVVLLKKYEKLLANPEENQNYQKELETTISQIDNLDAWDFESKVEQTLGILGIHDLQEKIKTLSGGQQKRLALAMVLLQKPDLLILDEPTNHLDIDAINWLEKLLQNQQQALLMITHDRYFLDNITTEIFELDNKQLYHYKGNYTYFLEKKAEREARFVAETMKARSLMRKEQEWMRRMPKARGTKSKARIDAFYDLEKKASQNLYEKKIQLNVKEKRVGGKILEIRNVSKKFDDKILLKKFDYTFKKGEKLGIIGNNGTGKSTFLKIILGKLQPDSGSVVTGQTIDYGYFDQSGLEFEEGQKIIDVVKEVADVIEVQKGHQITAEHFLEHFLFSRKKQQTHVSKLSGGEKRRLHLLKVLMRNPNFLILDEPTNDLDIITLSILEDFLLNFQGCLIVVSHDRYFLDSLVDHLFVFKGNGEIKDFPGNYSQYREFSKSIPKATPKNQVPKKQIEENKSPENKNQNKLAYKEKREFEQLEQEIENLESRKNELINLMNQGTGSHEDFATWGKEIKDLTEIIDQKSFRWMELAERC